MTLPPFPSQDLAKLVLGYLAEEQLMTAYDEFLQASPYLDALRNEYDRIFMTSLRNILAEYRAVRIYVETCKPFVLRKRLVQCTNLLEIVKFLATHVDLSRLSLDPHDKTSSYHSVVSHKHDCGECTTSSCLCKSKDKSNSVSDSQVEVTTDTSVETTALEDLPGNQPQKKQVKVLERELRLSETFSRHSDSVKQGPTVLTLSHQGPNLPIKQPNETTITGPMVKASDVGCREKIQEFNEILNKVCKNKSTVDTRIGQSSFQDFASGVSGHDNRNVPVPDSSTSESIPPLSATVKDISNLNSGSKNVKSDAELPKTNLLFHHRIKPNDPKIKIISDIKVDNAYTMANATSTPLVPSIVINGTPAYKPKLPVITKSSYTTDEIMAMPTIIVVTAADPSQNFTQTKALVSQNTNLATLNPVPATKLLGPLVIDISNTVGNSTKVMDLKAMDQATKNSGLDTGLVKADVLKNASVPKDNIISSSIQSSTPDVPPPSRKASSTPRRNSHIRVLDFTTPRRILQETIDENVPDDNTEQTDTQQTIENKTVEIVVSRSPNVIFPYPAEGRNNIIDMSSATVHKIHSCHINTTGVVNDNIKQFANKKSNWDSDLRLLATAANNKLDVVPKKSRSRSRQPKKKADTTQVDSKGAVESEPKKSRSKRKTSPKAKKSKKRQKIEDEEEDSVKPADNKVTVKPTFNLVSADIKNNEQDNKKLNDSNQSKHNKTDENNETPETERLSLQNDIGVKLNISDLLETPYKQVLYDIQMETPKFLGSVLPDEPISDIKITSIPTPRFFDTPKLIQTPSSYSSRPTDYSSGGSYYKPDDQDYLRVPDLQCPVTSSKSDIMNKDVESAIGIVHEEKKSTRPVRKCAKNVSYYNSSNSGNKMKDKTSDSKVDVDSSATDSPSGNSSFENVELKTPKENNCKPTPKSSIKKRTELSKKKKTPSKRDRPNTFMKIKPRRLTPTKLSTAKRSRKKSDLTKTDSSKKKSSAKDRQIHITPLVVAAPTKSRRKSSTPRKLHCNKIFNSESSGHDSPEINACSSKTTTSVQIDQISLHSQDSDTEQIALRWSDDGSQDAKPKVAETEDISKIQEYIITSASQKSDYNSSAATLHGDLIKRGFDAETAKSIERDLLDIPVHNEPITKTVTINKEDEVSLSKSVETDTSSNALHIVQGDESEDEFELSVHECNEDTGNYIVCSSDTNVTPNQQLTKLKDKFSMEVCIDDGVSIRLRANDFAILFNKDPLTEEELAYSFKETEVAVRSISNIDKLYTPLKDHRAQVYEIFDSTLTSLDTPLKANSPRAKEYETTQIEIVIEEEKVEFKDWTDTKKRKRLQSSTSSEEAAHDSKKTKPETQYLFNPTNIQNIDIESVLKKLHGP